MDDAADVIEVQEVTPISSKKPLQKASQFHHWRGLFQDVVEEHGYRPLRVEGKLPKDLAGTYWQNGTGKFSSHGQPIDHMFSGDGMIRSLRINQGEAQGAIKMINTQARQAEHAAGKRLYDGFGRLLPIKGQRWQRLRAFLTGEQLFKNTANTNVLFWQNKLLALFEPDLPTELDLYSLDYVGVTDLDGAIHGPFSAHPHWVSKRKTGYNFGVEIKGNKTLLNIYEMPADTACRLITSIPLDRRCLGYIHDFMATPNYLVFFVPPMHAGWGDLMGIMQGKSPFKAAKWQPELGTEIIIVPLDNPNQSIRFKTDPFFVIHFANAFESQGKIFVDYMHSQDELLYHQLGDLHRGLPIQYLKDTYPGLWDKKSTYSRLFRAEIDPQLMQFKTNMMVDTYNEFPRIHPGLQGSQHRFIYLLELEQKLCDSPLFTAINKVDMLTEKVESLHLGSEQYPMEPIFIRKKDSTREDEGYLLSIVYDGFKHSSYAAIIDTENFLEGPIAKLHFDQHLPMSFHGNWQDGF